MGSNKWKPIDMHHCAKNEEAKQIAENAHWQQSDAHVQSKEWNYW